MTEKITIIAQLLQKKDPESQSEAVRILRDTHLIEMVDICHTIPEEAALALLHHTDNPDWRIRSMIACVIGAFQNPLVIEPLLKFAEDPCTEVRIPATAGLKNRDDPRVRKAIRKLKEDQNERVRNWASSYLSFNYR